MKVLIETATNRKGYKHFDVFDDFKDFLNTNYKKIKQYQILEEDGDEISNTLKELAQECENLSNKLMNFYFSLGDDKAMYNPLLNASGRVYDACVAVKRCLK